MMYLTTHNLQLVKREVAEWTREHSPHLSLPSASTTTPTMSRRRNRHTEMSTGSQRAFTHHPTGLIDTHCCYLNPPHPVVIQIIIFYRAFAQKGKIKLRRGVIILLRLNVPLRPLTRIRHPWVSDSRNRSLVIGYPTARAVILFTVLGDECPSQTPAPIALQRLRDNRTARRPSRSPYLPKVILFIYSTWRVTRQEFISASHRIYLIKRYPLSQEILLSCTISDINSTRKTAGCQTIVLLIQID